MPLPNLIKRMRTEILVGDGGMGAYLHAKGVSLETAFDLLNLTNPRLIMDVHREYIEAGAQTIETNTFGANRVKLAAAGHAEKTRRINIAGAQIAREAAGERAYVLGSIGPTGDPKAQESRSPSDLFEEQADALAEGGADAFIVETFVRLDELTAAVSAAKRAADLPVIAQIAASAQEEAEPKRIVEALLEAGADAVGVNCGTGGPNAALKAVQAFAASTTAPLAAHANASFPTYVEGRYIYANNVPYFADMANKMAEAGANLVGGCCGTTPEHIRAVRRLIGRREPTPRQKRTSASGAKKGARSKRKRVSFAVPPPLNFLERKERDVKIIVEVDPPKGLNVDSAVRASEKLASAGADAVSVAENQLASPRMSSWALSRLIQRGAGIPAICHCTCRDRNLIGQQSELMGGYILGVNHVLAITGDPMSLGGHEGSSVFDTNSFGLIDIMNRLNAGENLRGESIDKPTQFIIGCGVNPNRRKLAGEMRRLEKKQSLGAVFAMTQPPADIHILRDLKRQTAEMPIEMFIGVIPLVSARNAEFLHNEVPGINLSDETRSRMANAPDAAAALREGALIAKEQVDQILDVGFKGVYIIPMLRRYSMALELIKHIRLQTQT